MSVFTRAVLSIGRQKGKYLLLLSIVFSTLIFSVGAISVREAVGHTDRNLRRRLPAIATILIDEEAVRSERDLGNWVEIDNVTSSLIHKIGDLPPVRLFDYTAWGHNFFSSSLVRSFQSDLFREAGSEFDQRDSASLRVQGEALERFILKGVQEPRVADLEADLIQLIDGRTFTEFEVTNIVPVALVSQEFLDANQLQLGSTLVLDYNIYYPLTGEINAEKFYADDNLLNSAIFEFEVIGVFQHELPDDYTFEDVQLHHQIVNRIYVPNIIIESTLDLYLETLDDETLALDSLEEMIQYEHIIFLLEDPDYLIDFQRTVNLMLPEFWIVNDLSNSYADIMAVMENFLWISDLILIGSLAATVVILSLLITLFLRDRKEEMGIYLALGSKKIHVLSQILIEVFLVSIIAMSLSFFSGSILAENISVNMIQNELAAKANEENFISIQANSPESMGFRYEMSHQEMLVAFQVSRDLDILLIFYGISIGTILLSTIFPIVYFTSLKPKKILF